MKKNVWKTLAGVLITALTACALAGCGASNEPANYEPLSVAYLNKAGYEDVIVGDHEGYFKDAGPEITLYPVTGSGQQSVEAMLAGSADLAATGQGPVADALKEYGDDIVIVAGYNCSTGGQVWVASPTLTGDKAIIPYDKNADNKDEVKASFGEAAKALGHPIRLGVQQGATTYGELKSWLKAFDISFNDFGAQADSSKMVTLVDINANTLPTTLASGTDIEMMAASQPYPDTALEQIPGAYKVGTNADIDSYGVSCYITTKEIFEKKQDSIKAYLKASQKACDFMNQNPDEAIQICADSIGTSTENVKSSFDIADFKVALSDKMIDCFLSTCKKKDVSIDQAQLVSQMPLKDWIDGGMK